MFVNDWIDPNVDILTEVTYESKKVKRQGPFINNVAPGVFFYFTQFALTGDGSEDYILIRETVDPNNGWPLFEVHSGQMWFFQIGTTTYIDPDTGLEVTENTCDQPAFDRSVDLTDLAQPVVDVQNATAGTYVVQVKYTPNSVVGKEPIPPEHHYDFYTYFEVDTGDPIDSAAGGLDLVRK
jgi:hypothetical protein